MYTVHSAVFLSAYAFSSSFPTELIRGIRNSEQVTNKLARQYYNFYLVLELGIRHEFSLCLVSGLSFKISFKACAQQGIEVTKLSIYISVKLWLRLCFNACAATQRKEISHELHFELNTGHPRA